MSDFDWSGYTRAPIVDTPGAVALARALLSAVPKSAPAQVKKAAAEVRSTTEALQAAWRAAPSEKAEDPRPIDTQYDNAWGALRDRLAPVASLPADEHPSAAKASAILERLFPSGKDFLTLPYAKQWAECEKRIATANEEGLVKDIDALAGKPFWSEIERLHKSYGEVLGITQAATAKERAMALLDPLRATQRSIAKYVLQLAAAAAHDQEFEQAAVRALAPIDAARAAASRRGSAAAPAEEVPVTPDTALPPVPTD